MKKAEGLLLPPSLKEHLSKLKQKARFKPLIREPAIAIDEVLELVDGVVSQIQADIDSKEYEESEDEWEDKIWLEGYLEAKEEDKALLVSPSTPTGGKKE